MAPSLESQGRNSRLPCLLWYLCFGILHESVHVLTAIALGLGKSIDSPGVFLLRAALGRACTIPSLMEATPWEAGMVQHAAWIFSVTLAVILWWLTPEKNKNYPHKTAAAVTALEAVCTDLLGIGVVAGVSSATLFCGNFGVILLHPAWTNTTGDSGKTALDLLEKMIEVTMMRGAQTGGVVTWVKKNPSSSCTPIRTRVVNAKRTDLSQELRKSLNKQVCSDGRLEPSIRCLMGHTRFATTSLATMDGTHPHTWSPPESRRTYPMDDLKLWKSSSPEPVVRMESNYITHNGDLDFYKVNGKHNDLETVQHWLEVATGHKMPATVDSAAIAGLVDIIRASGCFGLSLRYAYLVGSKKSAMNTDASLPSYQAYESLGLEFEDCLKDFCSKNGSSLADLKESSESRKRFLEHILGVLPRSSRFQSSPLKSKVTCERSLESAQIGGGIPLRELVKMTIQAFFKNDLFGTTKIFMKNAVGSFGLMVTSSMEAQRQIGIAARGQPMSIVFYPEKGIITYGSELAAVKAGLDFDAPASIPMVKRDSSGKFDVTTELCRFDLDDLGGEVVLLDFSEKAPDGRSIPKVTAHQESKTTGPNLKDRTTLLEHNENLLPLTKMTEDPILSDIEAIPYALDKIQTDWREGGLNRTTAWSLGRCLRRRLRDRLDGKIASHAATVDVLITGCEVSLWLGEQFASDLQKAFPKLYIKATSSNKLLGVFGQELAVPAIGFPMSDKVPDLKDTIVIIVSHSGGTFGPLAVSNLLQSVTSNIFVVSSEWDTQIGKQLRAMCAAQDEFLASRVFTTNIGVRPAEPCSLSVAATHQLLTQIFEYICMVVLCDQKFRHMAGAVVTERDLQVLERCNQDNILALETAVGMTANGQKKDTFPNEELKNAGSLWADHILENARAYIMSFAYVVVTVTIGYPLVTGIATGCGLSADWAFYITRFFDSLIYFFLPQINIIIIRLIQKRNLLHRMVGRTVVIGDIPWVAQSGEAFLSKIFARSYSIAGLNVLSGNPSDHLVHRHTHRVVRGSLLVCGRPDGRLTALTSSECAVNLSVNQASSIQSIGGTCESITIGHNPSKLSLTKMDISLATVRPQFLCEKILGTIDEETARKQAVLSSKQEAPEQKKSLRQISTFWKSSETMGSDESNNSDNGSIERSSHSLKGLYLGLQEKSTRIVTAEASSRFLNVYDDKSSRNFELSREMSKAFEPMPLDLSMEEEVLYSLIQENQKSTQLRELFNTLDEDGSGSIDLEEFVAAYEIVKSGTPRAQVEAIFHEADVDGSGALDFEEFSQIMAFSDVDVLRKLQQATLRDDRGLLQVQPSTENYFGESLSDVSMASVGDFAKSESQHFSMELYESRVASLQRFVSMCVMFHQTGKQVRDFFPKWSLGLMNYNMERTHSIMRIATTASPVSGDAVRAQMERLRLRARYQGAAHKIEGAWKEADLNHMRKLKEQWYGSQRHGLGASGSLNGSKQFMEDRSSASHTAQQTQKLEVTQEEQVQPLAAGTAPPARVTATFVNTGLDPAMEAAQLHYESTPFGAIGHKASLTVDTYPGHRWFIVANGVYAKMFTIAENAQQTFTV